MAIGKFISASIVVSTIVAMISLSVTAFLSPRTDDLTIMINSESQWTGEILIKDTSKFYLNPITISGSGIAQYFFERPEGMDNWQVQVKIIKTSSDHSELEIIIYDETNSKILARQKPQNQMVI